MDKELDQGYLEFLKALELIEVKEPEPLEYRIHYDEDGNIYMCSMQQHPADTQYVIATKEQYDHYYQYHVVKGKLKLVDNNTGIHVKLKSSDQGYATVKNHASIILESGEQFESEYWSTDV